MGELKHSSKMYTKYAHLVRKKETFAWWKGEKNTDPPFFITDILYFYSANNVSVFFFFF